MNLVGNPLGFLVAFGAGVLMSFSPCVYPLLPMVVGYVGAGAAGSRLKGFLLSVAYALGVAVTYATLGALAGLSGTFFGKLSGRPWPYFTVAAICIFFALAMFGVFELPVLSLTQRRIQPRGFISTFLFGMASGLVIGPCTAPVLGTILTYVGLRQNVVYGIFLLFCFALGTTVLLVIGGTFSGFIACLPRSGGWLNIMKRINGFILLAIGGYFLMQAVTLR